MSYKYTIKTQFFPFFFFFFLPYFFFFGGGGGGGFVPTPIDSSLRLPVDFQHASEQPLSYNYGPTGKSLGSNTGFEFERQYEVLECTL